MFERSGKTAVDSLIQAFRECGRKGPKNVLYGSRLFLVKLGLSDSFFKKKHAANSVKTLWSTPLVINSSIRKRPVLSYYKVMINIQIRSI